MRDCIECHADNGNQCVHDCDGQLGRNVMGRVVE